MSNIIPDILIKSKMRRDERVPAPEAGEAASLYPEVDTGWADWGEAEVRQRHVIMSA